MPKFNDIDLKNWKNSEVWTDSLWIIPERDKSGKHQGGYHGNFVPQIPHQMILRYSKKDDVIFDPFSGSGTTAFESEILERNFLGIEIQKELNEYVLRQLSSKSNFFKLITGDSTKSSNYNKVSAFLKSKNRQKVQLAILHPPYHDIIKFSDIEEDLSNTTDLSKFLEQFSEVVRNTLSILEKNRYLVLVIGDKYTKGEWIPLSFKCMQESLQLGLTLKSIIIKNMEGNRAKNNKRAIWRYRALSSDYYIFKHEYVMVFKNTGAK